MLKRFLMPLSEGISFFPSKKIFYQQYQGNHFHLHQLHSKSQTNLFCLLNLFWGYSRKLCPYNVHINFSSRHLSLTRMSCFMVLFYFELELGLCLCYLCSFSALHFFLLMFTCMFLFFFRSSSICTPELWQVCK